MTFAQRRNRLTTHISERIPVVQWRICVYAWRKWKQRLSNHEQRPRFSVIHS